MEERRGGEEGMEEEERGEEGRGGERRGGDGKEERGDGREERKGEGKLITQEQLDHVCNCVHNSFVPSPPTRSLLLASEIPKMTTAGDRGHVMRLETHVYVRTRDFRLVHNPSSWAAASQRHRPH